MIFGMSKFTNNDNGFQKKIITVGGGKGGVGKSIIAANLAAGLSLHGKRVIIVDADLGAANLHTILGIKSPPHGLKDFIFHGYPLRAILVDTGVENLKFISGAGDIPGISNIPHHVKWKLINHFKTLSTDYLVIDLAPGISHNIIDLFNITDNGILITTPEITSVLNTYSYVKAALYRRFMDAFKNNAEAREMIEIPGEPDNGFGIKGITGLKERLSTLNDSSRDMADNIIQRFRPRLILNRVRSSQDITISENIQLLIKKNLSVEIENLGYVVESESVMSSIENMKPFIIGDPQNKPSMCIQDIIYKLFNFTLKRGGTGDSLSPINHDYFEACSHESLEY